MYTEAQKFTQWLWCKSPHTSTHIHYSNDLKLFFVWANKPPAAITISDVDTLSPTINRRLILPILAGVFVGI